MNSKGFAGTLMLVALAVGALGTTGALAGQKFDSEVTIEYPGADPLYVGTVNSAKGACERNRKVLMMRRKSGGADVKTDVVVTTSAGAWEWDGDGAIVNRYYYGKVKRKSIAAGICKRDRSPALQNH
jgi:hypothetical protein